MADSDFCLCESPDIVVEESDNEETEVWQVCLFIILICGVFKKVLFNRFDLLFFNLRFYKIFTHDFLL